MSGRGRVRFFGHPLGHQLIIFPPGQSSPTPVSVSVVWPCLAYHSGPCFTHVPLPLPFSVRLHLRCMRRLGGWVLSLSTWSASSAAPSKFLAGSRNIGRAQYSHSVPSTRLNSKFLRVFWCCLYPYPRCVVVSVILTFASGFFVPCSGRELAACASVLLLRVALTFQCVMVSCSEVATRLG